MEEITTEESALNLLREAFKQLKIKATVEGVQIKGPLNRYEVKLDGIRLEKLQGYSKDIALIIGSKAPPIITPDYQNRQVIVEVMFEDHPIVYFTEMADSIEFPSKEVEDKYLPILMGAKDVDVPYVIDLAKMPHMVIAGATGSGKSSLTRAMINSLHLVNKTRKVEIVLIDPKYVEFDPYRNSPLMRYDTVYSTVSETNGVLDDLIVEMNRRLRVFQKYGCRDIVEYSKVKEIPPIVVFIDEIADLISGKKKDNKDFEHKLCNLAQKSRAAGIHLVIATQHPSAKVLTSEILANFPCKVCFKVSRPIHSRVVLDVSGAERLLGNGDGMILHPDGSLNRFKGAFVPQSDVLGRVEVKKKNFFKKKIGKLFGRG